MPDLSEGQLNDISRRIADKLILEGEIRRWFADSPELIDQIVGQALPKIESAISFPALRKIKRAAPIRIRVNDGDVNEDENGVQQGHTGPTLPDIINFHGATGWLETGDGRELHLTMGGGTDCMFDWLVSACYADLVAAGTHIEGQAFTSLTGCTFYVTSLIQNAWDGVGDGTAAKSFGTDCTVFICPGGSPNTGAAGGIGQLAISGDGGSGTHTVIFQGTNKEDSVIPGISVGGTTHAVTITGGDKTVIFRDIGFGGRTNSTTLADPPFKQTAGNQQLEFERCRFGGGTSEGPEFTVAAGGSKFFWDCEFPTSTAGEYALNMEGHTTYSLFVDCSFYDAFNVGTETHLIDPVFYVGNRAVAIIVPQGGTPTLRVQGAKARSSGSSFTYYIRNDADRMDTLSVEGWETSVSATAAAIIFTNSAFNNTSAVQRVVGNRWNCQLGFDATGITNEIQLHYEGNTHTGDGVMARGLFKNSVFEGNYPAKAYVDFESTSLSSFINRINGYQIGAGAPVHTANEGQLYFDATANSYYMNTSAESGTTWSVLGVSGGGAAAPSPHDFVGTHHSGDDDYTQSPNVLGLGVSTGDINLFSDAGTTRVGTWDGATGHATFGSTTAPDANTIIFATKTFTNPSTGTLAFNTTLTNAMSGAGNSSAITGNQAVVRATGAFTASGIHASFIANSTPGSSAVMSDVRGFYAQAQPASGTTITDRYGLHVANGVNAGSITNQYGVYIENMTKGGTINRAIQSLGGLSTHLGAFRIGSNTAPTNTTNGDITGTRLIVPDATIVHSAITQLGGPVVIPAGGQLRFSDADDSNYVGIKAPATAQSENWIINLPADDPVANDFLFVTSVSSPTVVTEWASTLSHSQVSTTSMKSTLVLMAASGKPTTTQGCAAAQVVEAGTNDVDYWVLDFDATSEERAFWNIIMPDNYDASVDMTAVFHFTAGSGDVRWGIQALALPNSAAIDTAYGTAAEVTTTSEGSTDVTVSGAATFAPGGTDGAGRLFIFRVYRDTSDAADTVAGDARLIGVQIEFGITALSA